MEGDCCAFTSTETNNRNNRAELLSAITVCFIIIFIGCILF